MWLTKILGHSKAFNLDLRLLPTAKPPAFQTTEGLMKTPAALFIGHPSRQALLNAHAVRPWAPESRYSR